MAALTWACLRVKSLANQAIWVTILTHTTPREILRLVPKMVKRTMQLPHLSAPEIPSAEVNAYLVEATSSYVFGLWHATSALCRAALEQGLKDRMGFRREFTLTQLMNKAFTKRLLDQWHRDVAKQIRDSGDEVLHERPSDHLKAKEVLLKTGQVLTHLYGAAPRKPRRSR